MRKSLILCFAFTLISFQSCIEIVNRITINADGTGKFSINIDFGILGQIAGGIKDVVEIPDLSFLNNLPSSLAKKLESVKGVSNIKYTSDESKKIYLLTFDFIDNKSLNRAIYAFFDQKKNCIKPSLIKYNRSSFKVKDLVPIAVRFKTVISNRIKKPELLKSVFLKSSYTFPGDITSFSNKKANILKNNKTIILKHSLDDIFEGRANTAIRIGFCKNKI